MDYNAPCSISARKFVRSCCRSPENLRFISCLLPAVFPLAITTHYIQCPVAAKALAYPPAILILSPHTRAMLQETCFRYPCCTTSAEEANDDHP
jgi:hypothetical protein